MSLFDVIRYPVRPNETFVSIVNRIPRPMAMAFYTHPKYQPSQANESFEDAYRRFEENTNLLRQVIQEWDE